MNPKPTDTPDRPAPPEPPPSDADVDYILSRFDQTDRQLQRRIVVSLMLDLDRFRAIVAAVEAKAAEWEKEPMQQQRNGQFAAALRRILGGR